MQDRRSSSCPGIAKGSTEYKFSQICVILGSTKNTEKHELNKQMPTNRGYFNHNSNKKHTDMQPKFDISLGDKVLEFKRARLNELLNYTVSAH